MLTVLLVWAYNPCVQAAMCSSSNSRSVAEKIAPFQHPYLSEQKATWLQSRKFVWAAAGLSLYLFNLQEKPEENKRGLPSD